MRKLIGLSAVACLTSTPGAPNTPTLTPDDCVFIAQYDALNDYTFASDFAFMAHHTDHLERNIYLQQPLKKKLLDVEISLAAASNIDQVDALNVGIEDFFLITRDHTPIRVTVREFGNLETESKGILVIFLVDKGNIKIFADDFNSNNLSEFSQYIKRLMNPGSTCGILTVLFDEEFEMSAMFVNAEHHNTPRAIASCMREEAYNSLGLTADPQGNVSLFSNPLWRGEPSEIEGDFGYGYRDELMLKMLYRSEFENGQSYAETQVEVAAIIATECAG
ncbi:hypothetical protein FHS89_000963 [Rubricella aquisinus]|uniref:Uncharacterized protein n=1 Tax=Rubricella aquisinus TaxID=2028108 RepID=A0A840X2R1_9RHOB|nr:hypothetical protein [Rubricella aquisinus]MBB5514957.1 hypothetical protein [Rubricella aquisinus]